MESSEDKRIGNQFWKLRRSFNGNPPKYKPLDLLEKCIEYFEWNEETPILTTEVVKVRVQGGAEEIKHETVPKVRAMTIRAMCLYLEIGTSTWEGYRKKKAYSGIVTYAEDVIFTQKFENAAAGLLKENLITRELGIKEKTEVTMIEQPLFNMDGKEDEDE